MKQRVDPDKQANWENGVATLSSKNVDGRQESVLDVFNEGDVSLKHFLDFKDAHLCRPIPLSVT